MIFNRHDKSTSSTASSTEAADEPSTDLAAEAARMRQKADGAAGRATRLRDEARADLEEAQRQADGIMAAAKSAAMAPAPTPTRPSVRPATSPTGPGGLIRPRPSRRALTSSTPRWPR